MEDLNKNQFILLVLLVTFVTSIATGIITNTLLQEAPIEVTRTINQVVEKTIETVTPASVFTKTPNKETTTVVVKEEDLVIDSTNKNNKSIVRIKEETSVGGFVSFYGIGVVVSKDGQIVAERKPITVGNVYVGVLSDGSEVELNPIGVDKKSNFILFKLLKPASVTATFVPVVYASSDVKLGQSVIALGGDEQNAIAVGRVTSLFSKTQDVGTTSTKYLSGIDTDISTKDLVSGSPLVNLNGELVGIKISEDPSQVFYPISLFKKEIATLVQ